MSFKFSGGVEVLGFISPTEPTDQYPVIDPLYGIDGFRNVDTLLDLNAIPNLRRRAGMVVGINGGAQYYKLNPSPWNGTITDWSIFNTGGGGNPYVTGFTYDNSNTFTILTSSPSIFNATINEVTGLTINGNLLVTGNTNLFGLSTYQGPVTGLNTKELINYEYLTSYVSANDIYSTGGTVSQYPSPSSNVVSVQIDGNSGFTPFNITGLTDTFINDFSYSANTFTISQNDGSNFDAIIDTINLESVLSAATFDIGTTGTISANIFSGGTYYGDGSNLSGITTANVFVYSGNANVSTSELTFLNTTGGTFTVTNSAALFADNDINVTGGTYNPTTGCVTFTTNSGTTFDVCGFLTGFTDTYVTGATFSANQVILSRNDGFDVLKISGGTNVTLTNPSTNEIVIGVTIPPDTNTFVTGFTYNDNNTFTLTRNDGVDISTSINIVTGLTVNGDIEMGNSSTRQIYSTGVSEISSIEFTTSGTSVQMRWDGSGNSTVFTVNNTDFATLSSNKTAFGGLTYGSDYSPYYTDRSLIDLGYFNSNNRYVTGGTYDNGTALISYSGANGFPSFSVDMSSLDLNDTYVTGGTLTQPTDNTNSGLINLLYSQDVSPSTYSIPYTDTFITGFTYNNNNTFTIVENNGDTYSVTFNEVSGLTVNGDLNVTGNTYLVDVSGTSLFTDYIDFRNIGASLPTDQQGRIYWDDDNGTLSLGMYGGQVVQQIGLEKYYYIKNQSGATISNGRVVRAAGTLGASGRILGEYMIADGTIPPKFTLGIATEDIINGDDGYVTEFGLVRGINTTGTPYGEVWNDGDILWVSPTIPGGLTKVEPQAPNLKIEIAIVIYANANGSIFVRPNRYPYLYDIQQVNYSAGTENNLDILFWNNSNQTWDKTNTPSFSGLTIYGDTTQIGNFNITGNTLQNGNTTTNGNVDIITTGGTGCTLSVTGKTCLDGDLEVTGNVFVVGNLDYDGNLIVTGSTIISSGLTVFSGVSADFITITTTPTENNDLIQILGRNSSTGDVEYRDVKTIGNNITTVTGTTYSATTTDDVIGIDSSTNTVTLYLPDSVSSGRLRYDIKDIGVNSFNNPITIQAAGSDTIITTSVVSSFELSADGGAVILVNTGTGQWWQM